MIDLKQAYVQRNFYNGAYAIHLRTRSGIVTDVKATIDNSNDLGKYHGASMQLSDESIQMLFQAMWDAGLRPHSGESSVAHVEAMKNHLKDMQEFARRGFTALENILTRKES